MSKSKAYHAELIEGLRDPIEAEEYLNAALEEEDPELFLVALRNVAEAQGVSRNSPRRRNSTASIFTRCCRSVGILS